MDAIDFLSLSSKLVFQGSAGARSAVSRAYYASFHMARAVLDEIASEECGNSAAHALVPQYLQKANHPDSIAAGHLLADLHSERIKADYKLGNVNAETTAFAKASVETATAIQKRLETFGQACRKDAEVRQKLRDGIQKVKDLHKSR